MNRTIKEATVKVFHYPDIDSLKAHVLAFVSAYNFAKHLKALRWKTPFEAVSHAWTITPDIFKLNVDDPGGVHVVGQRDVDRLDGGIGEEGAVAGVMAGHAGFVREGVGLGLVARGDGLDGDEVRVGEIVGRCWRRGGCRGGASGSWGEHGGAGRGRQFRAGRPIPRRGGGPIVQARRRRSGCASGPRCQAGSGSI